MPKSTVIFQKPVELGVFPNHSINIVTPNIYELSAMYDVARENGYFEILPWWSLVDSLRIPADFRESVTL